MQSKARQRWTERERGRGVRARRKLKQKLKKLHNEPELKVQQKRIITAYLMAHYGLLCLVYQERWLTLTLLLLLLLLCVCNTLHVSSCTLAQGIYIKPEQATLFSFKYNI